MTRAFVTLLPVVLVVIWVWRHVATVDRWPWWQLAALPSLAMIVCIIILITHDTWIGGRRWKE